MLAAGFAASPVAQAQLAPTFAVRADNDAFNFWLEPGARPDREYTSGVVVRYDGGDAPGWAKWLARNLPSCAEHAGPCRTRRFEIGQQMFTPERSGDTAEPPAGARPNAGWLFAGDGVRLLHDTRQRELSVTVGVTGPPALAAQTQRLFHSITPGFNRPIDWSEQLAFEPGLVLSFEETGRVFARDGGRVGFDVLPRASVHAGNVNTSAEAGVRLRVGFGLRHPWLAPASDGTELALEFGGATQYVARDLFLDGNTGGDGGVGHKPLVHRAAWVLSVRRRWLAVSYGAVTQTRTYPTGPARHTWSTLRVSLTPAALVR